MDIPNVSIRRTSTVLGMSFLTEGVLWRCNRGHGRYFFITVFMVHKQHFE